MKKICKRCLFYTHPRNSRKKYCKASRNSHPIKSGFCKRQHVLEVYSFQAQHWQHIADMTRNKNDHGIYYQKYKEPYFCWFLWSQKIYTKNGLSLVGFMPMVSCRMFSLFGFVFPLVLFVSVVGKRRKIETDFNKTGVK